MEYCTSCGHQLGIGRYCTNCGARVPVPPAEGSPPPPPPGPEPTTARYPLFADTVPAAPAPYPVVVPTVPPPARPPGSGRRSALPWVVAALAVLAVIAVVGVLLVVLGGSDEDATGARREPGAPADRRTDASGAGSSVGGSPSDVLSPSDVQVPGTAPASVDSDGAPVTFVAGNMLDADPRTSWRVAGDASGSVITFTFDHPVTLTQVGLINGYAKTDPPHDWYAGNRRVTDVTWSFDDGTEVAQTLDTTRSVQTIDVDSVETTTVELHIDGVTAPGAGPDARDYTAISEVVFAGS